MPRLLTFVIVMLLCALLLGCGDSDDVTGFSRFVDGSTLFGLSDNNTLIYIQTDTIIDSSLNLSVSVTDVTVSIAQDSAAWIVKNGSSPVLNLLVTDDWVLLNGYWWTAQGGTNVRTFFPQPPVLMPRTLNVGDQWEGFTPEYGADSENPHLLFYFSYFGFFFTREFVGRQLVHLPAGSYDAYRFDVRLFRNQQGGTSVAEVEEYYYPSVGLVRLNFRGGGLNRTLSLKPSSR